MENEKIVHPHSSEDLTWVRSQNGVIAGVCRGLADRFGMDVTLVRVLWVISVLFLGFGLGLYIMLALSLPREGQITGAYDSKLLGVCARISRKTGLEPGVVRFLALLLGLLSFGATIIGYLVLYFLLPETEEEKQAF